MERILSALIMERDQDTKVIRWALNAIAHFGTDKISSHAVEVCLEKYADVPSLAASALASLFRIDQRALYRVRANFGFSQELIALSCLRMPNFARKELPDVEIDIEGTTPDLLQLALIIVGLGNNPDTLFHPKMSTGELIGKMGGHDDSIVRQYSIWAITENPVLSIEDAGIRFEDITNQPENVRGWLYRLAALDAHRFKEIPDIVKMGSRDDSDKARELLAIGLKDSYFDGVDELVMEWNSCEPNVDIRERLFDHMIHQMHNSNGYREYVLEFFGREPKGSRYRQRIWGVAARTPAYATLQKHEAEEDEGALFAGEPVMSEGSKKTYNINIESVQSGSFAIGGDAKTSRSETRNVKKGDSEQIREILHGIRDILGEREIDEGSRQRLEQYVQEAEENPTEGNLHRVHEAFSKVVGMINQGSAAAARANQLLEMLGGTF
jgi:hypothetical protein